MKILSTLFILVLIKMTNQNTISDIYNILIGRILEYKYQTPTRTFYDHKSWSIANGNKSLSSMFVLVSEN